MSNDYGTRADRGVPGRPEPPSNMDILRKNPVPAGPTAIPDERKPELLRYLDEQMTLDKRMWEVLMRLNEKLAPVLRKPQDTTSNNDIAEIAPTTTVTAMLHEHATSMRNMIGNITEIIERLEV